MNKFFRLQRKLNLVILFIVGTTILGMAYFAAQNYYQDKKDYLSDLSSITALNTSSLIDRELRTVFQQVSLFHEILIRMEGKKDSNALLQQAFQKMESVAQLEVHDEKGLKLRIGESVPIHVEAGGTLLYIDQNSVILSVQIEKTLYLARLKKALLDQHLNLTTAMGVFLADSKGVILIKNASTQSSLIERIPDELLTNFQMRERQAVVGRTMIFNDQDPGFASVSPLSSLPSYGVVTVVRFYEIYPMIWNVIKSSYGFVVILALFSVLIGTLFSNQIIRPIEELTQAVSQMATGNWVVKMKARSRDEIGRLVKAFSNMGLELAKRDQQLQEAQKELLRVERLAVLGQFGAGIAHEVKNPLNSVLGYAQLLQRKNTNDPTSNEYLQFIMDETRRASRIINDLLTFARQKAPSRQKISVSEIIDYSLGTLRPLANQARVELKTQLENGQTILLVDRDQMVQVIVNLVTNAIHSFEENGSGERVIEIHTRDESELHLFKIKDNGAGISEENLAKIFEPFFTTKKTNKGSGLGLSLCYGIIQAHQGQIQLDSKLGNGTTVTFRIP